MFSPSFQLKLKKFIKEIAGDDEDELEGAEHAEEILVRSTPSSMNKKQSLRFNKDSRLERVDSTEETPSIIRRRTMPTEVIRDREFDEGDPDTFLANQMPRTARRGRAMRTTGIPRRRTRAGAAAAAAAASTEAVHEDEPAEEGPEQQEETVVPRRKGKGKELPASQQSKQRNNDDFEVEEDELEMAQVESENRRAARQKKRRVLELEEEGSNHDPSEDGASSSKQLPQQQSKAKKGKASPSKPKPKVPKQERAGVYRYATHGNQHGRVAWSEEERGCLLSDLQHLYPRYVAAMEENSYFAVWREILRRHGPDGEISSTLQNRNNVQLKDKARNECERIKRAKETVPEWLAPYG